jgi:hypothetical protein
MFYIHYKKRNSIGTLVSKIWTGKQMSYLIEKRDSPDGRERTLTNKIA